MASGNFGTSELLADIDTLVCTLSATKVTTLNILFSNRNATEVKIRVYLGTAVSPLPENNVAYDVSVPGNWTAEYTGIVCSPGEKVWLRSDTANVSCRVHGFEE